MKFRSSFCILQRKHPSLILSQEKALPNPAERCKSPRMFSGTAGDKNSPETVSRNPSLFPPPHPLFPLHLLNTKLMFQLLAILLFNVFQMLIFCQLPYFSDKTAIFPSPTFLRVPVPDPLLKVKVELATTNDLLKKRRK